MQSVLIIQCFICKVSLLFSALYAKCLLFSALYAKCPYYSVLYVQSGRAQGRHDRVHYQLPCLRLPLAWTVYACIIVLDICKKIIDFAARWYISPRINKYTRVFGKIANSSVHQHVILHTRTTPSEVKWDLWLQSIITVTPPLDARSDPPGRFPCVFWV